MAMVPKTASLAALALCWALAPPMVMCAPNSPSAAVVAASVAEACVVL